MTPLKISVAILIQNVVKCKPDLRCNLTFYRSLSESGSFLIINKRKRQMLTKTSLYSIIHRWTTLTRKLEKRYSPGSVGTFLLGFGFCICTTLGVMSSKLHLVSLERERCCGWSWKEVILSQCSRSPSYATISPSPHP